MSYLIFWMVGCITPTIFHENNHNSIDLRILLSVNIADADTVSPEEIIGLANQSLTMDLTVDQQTRVLWLRAMAYYRTRKIQEAITDLRAVLNLNPKDSTARIAGTYFLQKTTHLSEAEQFLQELLKQYPSDARILAVLAAISYEQNKPKEALAYFQKAKKISPDNWSLYLIGYGMSMSDIDSEPLPRIAKLTEIIEGWNGTTEWLPVTLSEAYRLRALTYHSLLSDYRKAASDLTVAKALYSPVGTGYSIRELTILNYLRFGEYALAKLATDEMVGYLEKNKDSFAVNTAEYRSLSLILSGELVKAKKIADSNSNASDPRILWAQIYLLLGEYQKTIDILEMLRKQSNSVSLPERATLAYLLTTCPDSKIHNPKRALELSSDFEKDYPKNAKALMIRAIVLAENQEFDKAVNLAVKACDLLPKHSKIFDLYSRQIGLFKEKKLFRINQSDPDFDVLFK